MEMVTGWVTVWIRAGMLSIREVLDRYMQRRHLSATPWEGLAAGVGVIPANERLRVSLAHKVRWPLSVGLAAFASARRV
jgi:hypothetical protein